jgi:2-keto-4-pentenoate hydratase/2-oxohepta-3-ene-1,7-dioic acid hydratase in catechol pathway
VRLANYHGRAALVLDGDRILDVATASDGRFGPDPAGVYAAWSDLVAWSATIAPGDGRSVPVDRTLLDAPSPAPRQVFAVGLNYSEHAAESGFSAPTDLPPVFTKYVSSFSGPDSVVIMPPGGNVDWEIELVAVIGREARDIADADGWNHVAGLTAGQDISERISQLRGPAAQFGLGKSFPGFSPQGPWLVTPDEFPNPDDIGLGCSVDGEEVQHGRTRDLIFSVPRIVGALSRIVTLYPGDVIFTGTPAGVGLGREPQRYLEPGQRLDSWIEGIGEMHQSFVAADGAA